MISRLAGLVWVLFGVSATIVAQEIPDKIKPFLRLDFSKSKLTQAQLNPLIQFDRAAAENDAEERAVLPLLRGIVFGRHGRVFKEKPIQDFLKSQSWYHPNSAFTNESLNATERSNLDLIRGAEAEAHARIMPGDLRFFMNRAIRLPKDMIVTGTDLAIMLAEIEAIHGKRFDSQPLLQKYFEERYWYQPRANYKLTELSKFEHQNLATLRSRLAETRKGEISARDILSFDKSLIAADKLETLTLYDLRLLRNALYAMRGYKFKTPWIREYFESEEWYVPSKNQASVKLIKNDESNLKTILAVERQKHDALSTEKLNIEYLRGLFVEDIRKLASEIPARHGKVFTDKSLKEYFTSLPWYKPNAKYREADLNATEKDNLRRLNQLLAETKTRFNFAEG